MGNITSRDYNRPAIIVLTLVHKELTLCGCSSFLSIWRFCLIDRHRKKNLNSSHFFHHLFPLKIYPETSQCTQEKGHYHQFPMPAAKSPPRFLSFLPYAQSTNKSSWAWPQACSEFDYFHSLSPPHPLLTPSPVAGTASELTGLLASELVPSPLFFMQQPGWSL